MYVIYYVVAESKGFEIPAPLVVDCNIYSSG
jgi:hypothetical protein